MRNQRTFKSVNRLLFVVAALLVGACAIRPSPWAKTDPAQISKSPDLATVVVGQTYLGQVLAKESCPQTLRSHWGSAETRTLAFQIHDFECVGADQPPTRDFTRLLAKYTIVQLRPGNYRLDQVNRFRRFQPEMTTQIQDTRPTPNGWSDMTVPRFAVAAGEVVYVGTLVYLRSDPVELRTTTNLEHARDALRAIWPEGAERLIERRMLVGTAR